ncbi:MAG: ATP-binding cassette domain-containing protein [Phycisphaeraceae bacterium]
MHVHLKCSRHTHVQPSPRVLRVAGMFGLGIDEERSIAVVPPTDLSLDGGQIVFVTGPSGSGKSTLLHLIAKACAKADQGRVLPFDDLPPLPDRPLVDCLDAGAGDEADASLAMVTRWLSLAGLNDAFVMLRRPCELSDGQRYRLRLAQVMSMIERASPDTPTTDTLNIILADEFAATLDRLTAAIVARNIRKWVSHSTVPVCFVAATTHDDLLEHLEPNVLVIKHLGEKLEVLTR